MLSDSLKCFDLCRKLMKENSFRADEKFQFLITSRWSRVARGPEHCPYGISVHISCLSWMFTNLLISNHSRSSERRSPFLFFLMFRWAIQKVFVWWKQQSFQQSISPKWQEWVSETRQLYHFQGALNFVSKSSARHGYEVTKHICCYWEGYFIRRWFRWSRCDNKKSIPV